MLQKIDLKILRQIVVHIYITVRFRIADKIHLQTNCQEIQHPFNCTSAPTFFRILQGSHYIVFLFHFVFTENWDHSLLDLQSFSILFEKVRCYLHHQRKKTCQTKGTLTHFIIKKPICSTVHVTLLALKLPSLHSEVEFHTKQLEHGAQLFLFFSNQTTHLLSLLSRVR